MARVIFFLVFYAIFLISQSTAQEWLYPQKPMKTDSKSESMAKSAASIIAQATSKLKKNAAAAMVEIETKRKDIPDLAPRKLRKTYAQQRSDAKKLREKYPEKKSWKYRSQIVEDTSNICRNPVKTVP